MIAVKGMTMPKRCIEYVGAWHLHPSGLFCIILHILFSILQ